MPDQHNLPEGAQWPQVDTSHLEDLLRRLDESRWELERAISRADDVAQKMRSAAREAESAASRISMDASRISRGYSDA